jgi:trigger factor
MQVTETLNSGLKREIKVTVPAGDMEAVWLDKRLDDAQGQGPHQRLPPRQGADAASEARCTASRSWPRSSTRSSTTRPATFFAERGEKAAMQPEVIMTEDEKEAEKVLAGGADFEFELTYEVIPSIEIQGRLRTSRSPARSTTCRKNEIDEQVKRVAESARSYEPKKGKAELRATGSPSTIVGKVGGEAFDGGAGADQPLVLGSGEFIPGFEDQLDRSPRPAKRNLVEVTFPENYSHAGLAGKEATFDVTVKEV